MIHPPEVHCLDRDAYVKSLLGTDRHLYGVERAAAARWHSLEAMEALSALRSSPQGLSSPEAQERLSGYGPNTLPPAKPSGWLRRLWRPINHPSMWVLLVSGAVAGAVDPFEGYRTALVILGAVVFSATVGSIQERRVKRTLATLRQGAPQRVEVLRDGQSVMLSAPELVPGDVVRLAAGDRVAADMRLIAARSLAVDEAALRGKSMPLAIKGVTPVAAGAPLGERSSMVYLGTLVCHGVGRAVVVETGRCTELGRLCSLPEQGLDTPLSQSLARHESHVTWAIAILALILTGLAIARASIGSGLDAIGEALLIAVALAAAAIPLGLPVLLGITLNIGMRRIADRGTLIRRLAAVEALGATSMICSGKTGVLTRNEMTARVLWTPKDVYAVTGSGYVPKGLFTRAGTALDEPPLDLRQLLIAAALCNDAALVRSEQHWAIAGAPTEGALVVVAEKAGIAVDPLRETHRRLGDIPFDPESRLMATLNAATHGQSSTIIVKGAPEVVLERCRLQAGGGRVRAGTALQETERLAAKGMRVLALAAKTASAGKQGLLPEDLEGDFVLLGLVGMIDPPRPEVIEAVRLCHEAGITVKMLTGDHKATAEAIGGQLNILLGEAPVIEGAQLAEMDDEAIAQAVECTNVFARIASEHKLELVRALQRKNEIVALIGGRASEAVALRQANIGVASTTGTEFSKERAALIGEDFAALIGAVEEGRCVYDNATKWLAFVLPTNLGLAILLLAAVAFFPYVERLLPMQPVQLLWINLVTALALASPLAFEAKEPDLMQYPPRPPAASLLGAFVIGRTVRVGSLMAAAVLGVFWWEYAQASAEGLSDLSTGGVRAQVQTTAVTTAIVFQMFYLMSCRSPRHSAFKLGLFSNTAVFAGLGSAIGLQLLFIYAPFMHAAFGSAALGWQELGAAIGVGASILPVIALEKRWRRRKLQSRRLAGTQGAGPRMLGEIRASVPISRASSGRPLSPLVSKAAELMSGLTEAQQREILSEIEDKRQQNEVE